MNFYDEAGLVQAQPNLPDIFRKIEGLDDAGYLMYWDNATHAFQRLMKHMEDGGPQAEVIAHCLLDLNGMSSKGFYQNDFKALEIDAFMNCQTVIGFNNVLQVPLQDAFKDGEKWFDRIRTSWGGRQSLFALTLR